ncbi:hypothetical protein L593_02815 [Salinarchaeum sp. Harcht-Bsk1]|nr:hypothetical protein L593_02815 [Salinarchaeum sp. Harcht-Bsk1]
MHCSADLTAEREAADADDDGVWDSAEIPASGWGEEAADADQSLEAGAGGAAESGARGAAESGTGDAAGSGTDGTATSVDQHDGLLDPQGIVDDALTVVVGILGGIVVGLVATVVLLILTGSGWALLFGFVGWLGATAYLVRRRTVQGAISKSAYAVAAVFLLIPLVVASPVIHVEGGVEDRVEGFLVLLVLVAFPAGVAAVVGFVAARFVPEEADGSID